MKVDLVGGPCRSYFRGFDRKRSHNGVYWEVSGGEKMEYFHRLLLGFLTVALVFVVQFLFKVCFLSFLRFLNMSTSILISHH